MLFHYKAITSTGEVQEGEMDGPDRQTVINQLQNAGLMPLQAQPASASTGLQMKSWSLFRRGNQAGQRQVMQLTEQLATLLEAGVSLDRALEILQQVSSDALLLELVADIQNTVRGGESLSVALAAHPKLFNRFYISLVQSGELVGDQGEGLKQLALYLEKSKALRERVTSAMLYPAILLVVTCLSLALILIYVVPQFADLFDEMGAALPLSTRIVLATADGLSRYGAATALLIIAGCWLFNRRLQQASVRQRWDARLLRLPLLGSLLLKIDVARFSYSLGTLLKGGLPLLQALPIARDVIANHILSHAVADALANLREGKGLAQPLIDAKVFPELAVQMIKVGEETAQLDAMLLRIAKVYEREVDTALQRTLTILEPLLIVGLGVIIGAIIMSILAAIVGINQLPT